MSNNEHVWKEAGLWDGTDPESGKPIGGKVYKCSCGTRAQKLDQLLEHGGTINGKPVEEFVQTQKEISKKTRENLA